MFRVVLGKMTEYNISWEELSKYTGMSVKVLKQCIKTGERKIRLFEAVLVRDYVAPDMGIDELFKPVTSRKAEIEAAETEEQQ